MYTQCANCQTVFRLSAEVLRAAGGQVRCGRCGEVFNALARLAEDASAFPAAESPLEMEARADKILQSAVPPLDLSGAQADDTEDLRGTDIEFARLQVVEKFVEEAPPAPSVRAPGAAQSPAAQSPAAQSPAAQSPAAQSPAARATAPIRPAPPRPAPAPDAEDLDALDDHSMEFTLPPGELDRVFVERTERARPAPGHPEAPSAPDTVAAADGIEPPGARNLGLEVSEEVRRDILSGVAAPELPQIAPAVRARTLPFGVWLAAALALAALLLAQIANANRDWLAAHLPLRGPLQGVYAALGVAVESPASLASYQLRQWGVTGEPSASGTLRVRASILNTAAQLQPYPLLRVTLANRFGVRIGTRDFEPAEYMGKPVVRWLAPGERVDATLDIVDPGKDAEGFEIDVCLRGSDQKIACAGDAATQAKPR